jgi:hypothetical protein
MIFPTNHINIDVPDCPSAPAPNFHGIPTWVLGWGMGIGTVLIIATGILIAYWIDSRVRIKQAHANAAAEMSKHWTTCPTCKADFHPVYNPKKPEAFSGP